MRQAGGGRHPRGLRRPRREDRLQDPRGPQHRPRALHAHSGREGGRGRQHLRPRSLQRDCSDERRRVCCEGARGDQDPRLTQPTQQLKATVHKGRSPFFMPKREKAADTAAFLLHKKVQVFASFDIGHYTSNLLTFAQITQNILPVDTSPYASTETCTFATAPSCEREACSKRPCICVRRNAREGGERWNRRCGAKSSCPAPLVALLPTASMAASAGIWSTPPTVKSARPAKRSAALSRTS